MSLSQQIARRTRHSEDVRVARSASDFLQEEISGSTVVHRSRRRKSDSPDNSNDQRHDASERPLGRKQRGPSALPNAALADPAADRGRKSRLRPLLAILPTQSRNAAENNNWREHEHTSRKERSRSRESHGNRRHPSQAAASSVQDNSTASITADLNRLKQEMDALKQQVRGYRNTIKLQDRAIETLKKSVSERSKSLRDQENRISKLKNHARKSDELISTIETTLVCQICLELLVKPYALSPCGHIHCLSCLQEWFRKAPPADDDMYDDDPSDPYYLLHRRKSCPCCRAYVKHPPAPVFLVKSIATALMKAKGHIEASPPPDSDTDVWAGLFCDAHHDDSGDDEDFDDEDFDDVDDEDEENEDDGDGDEEEFEDDDDIFSYGSDSNSDPFQGRYVPAQWEPPSVTIDAMAGEYAHRDLDQEHFAMVRRGATLRMIDAYDMHYTHENGLIATVDVYTIYLGWNVRLSTDDPDGVRYIDRILDDIDNRPERWACVREDYAVVAKRLVPEDEVEDYSTTDSEEFL